MTPTPERLVEYWLYRAARMQEAHYTAGRSLGQRHIWLGIGAVTLGALVGGTVFASLSKDTSIELKILTGVLSVFATVLTALQTFLKDFEASEKHKVAGAKLAHLKHTIELVQVLPPASGDELRTKLSEIEAEWATARLDSPNLPPRLWRKVESTLTLSTFLPGTHWHARVIPNANARRQNIRTPALCNLHPLCL